MLRFLSVTLIWIGFASYSSAQPLRVTSAAATYWSAADEVEILVWYDRAPDLATMDYIQFGGVTPSGVWPPDYGFTFSNHSHTFGEELILTAIDYGPPHREINNGAVAYDLQANLLSVTIPFDRLQLDSPIFDFSAFARTSNGFAFPPLEGVSSIDTRVVYVPEPAALLLASICGSCLLGYRYLARRRR
jgi:hypothetical protein